MLILLQALVYISLIWSLHLPFELKVTPRCLWDFEFSSKVPFKNKGDKLAIYSLENNMDLVFAALNVIPQSLDH
jgi:hypothetical protein